MTSSLMALGTWVMRNTCPNHMLTGKKKKTEKKEQDRKTGRKKEKNTLWHIDFGEDYGFWFKEDKLHCF